MSPRSLWLTSYDIANPRRLRKVATLCEDIGRRIQQSVFLCHTDLSRQRQFLADVNQVIDPACDHLLVLPICKRCRRTIEQHGQTLRLPGEQSTTII